MYPNKCLIFKRHPVGWPVAGEHLVVEDRPFDPDAPPPPGGFTAKNLYLSLDPFQRGQMRPPEQRSSNYSPSWVIDEPAVLMTLAVVLRSDNASFQPGALVHAAAGAGQYARVPAAMAALSFAYPPLPPGVSVPQPVLLGALGISGLSAYVSLREFVREPRAGKTLLVSAASGGVGQIVGQMARIYGMRVIGSTGGPDKVDFVLNELGFDGAWDYKAESTADALRRLAPEGIDVYYDNVGGEQLETALDHMNLFGQVVVSGMVSQYNVPRDQKYGVKTLMEIVYRRLSINGFICSDPQYKKYGPDFAKDMVTWLAEGKIKTKEEVAVGMDNAAEALIKVWKGDKFGKMVLKTDEN